MEICPMCEREMYYSSDHHLVPKCRGGKRGDNMMLICRDCHEAIHAIFSNKELESDYNDVDSLLSNEKLAKTIKFISKQNPQYRTKTKLAKNQKKRKRNG